MLETLLNNLRIDPRVLLFNGIVFLFLLKVLDALFWKPMMRHLEKRKQEIAHAYHSVDEARREMENLRAEYQSRLARIEAEARGRIQETVRDAQHQREAMIAQARAQAEEIVRQGTESIERDKAETVAAMRDQIDDVAFAALAKAIRSPGDPAQKKLIDDYVVEHVIKM